MQNHFSRGIGGVVLVAIVATLMIAGVGAYYYVNSKQSVAGESRPAASNLPNNETNHSDDDYSHSTLADLFSASDSLHCTFTQDENGVKSSGNVYVSGENMRGNFESITAEGTFSTNMLKNGSTGYTWQTGSSQGFQLELSDPEELFSGNSTETSEDHENAHIDSSVEVHCDPWSEDVSLFSPPSNVEFVSVQQFMQQESNMQMEVDEQSTGSACSACDQAPTAETQAQCRKALGC